MEIYHDQVIEAAYLHSKPGCFFIGPFARRVSFASQQHRALDLVAALAKKNKLINRDTDKPKTIAVIGAGVAGLTAAAALRGQNCKVHLYERCATLLTLQQHANHRLIHPTIARWPVGKFELTTSFAFLDWFAATSDVVIESMRLQWETHLKPDDEDPDFRFLPGITVERLLTETSPVRLETTPSPNVPPKDIATTRYDYVIVTTGFGEEESPLGLKSISYWKEDEVDDWRRDQKKVFVSGCGDGGLIDALRLVHADFDRGWLSIRLAEMLGKTFHDEIREAEEDALMAAKSLACMDFAENQDGDALAHRKVGARYENDDIVTQLTKFYDDLIPDLPQPVMGLLDESLDAADVQPGKVILVSRQPKPFGPYAAPIHKIMVSHAMYRGRMEYRQGELLNVKGKPVIQEMKNRLREPIADNMRLVIRHGSPANLAGLTSPSERNSLRIRQFMLADYVDTELERVLAPPKGYPSREDSGALYIGSRYEMVKTLVDSILPGARVYASAKGYSFVAPAFPLLNRKSIQVAMPKQVFGLGLAPGEMPVVSAL